jgi:hypothetical protein
MGSEGSRHKKGTAQGSVEVGDGCIVGVFVLTGVTVFVEVSGEEVSVIKTGFFIESQPARKMKTKTRMLILFILFIPPPQIKEDIL